MDVFERFLSEAFQDQRPKGEQAIALLWFHCRSSGAQEATLTEVSDLFAAAALPRPNLTRLREFFRKSKDVHKGSTAVAYRLSRSAVANLESAFGHLFEAGEEVKVCDKAGVSEAPLLTEEDVANAFQMAELYVVLHCYENSVRRVIEHVLSKALGDDWWSLVANGPMRSKVADRRQKEERSRWLQPRGGSPLFYLDWGDLVGVIRKHEGAFAFHIGDLKFVELRLEELERLRNVVAHHGTLTSADDYQRVVLSFRDWCRQIKV